MSALTPTRDALAKELLKHEVVEAGCTCGGDCGWTHGDWIDHVADALLASGAVVVADTLADDEAVVARACRAVLHRWPADEPITSEDRAQVRVVLQTVAAALAERGEQ